LLIGNGVTLADDAAGCPPKIRPEMGNLPKNWWVLMWPTTTSGGGVFWRGAHPPALFY
jgi:hypothetical protein